MLGNAEDIIYLFGDSITQFGYDPMNCGWVAALSHAYSRRMTVINAGLSGYSTDQALDILPRMLPSPSQANIKLFVVFFGANDSRLANTAAADGTSPDQHVPQHKYKQNLRDIVMHAGVRAHEGVKVVLVTPPPVDENMLTRKNRRAETTRGYAAQVRVLAAELRNEGLEVRCLDLWAHFMKRCGWSVGEPLLGELKVESNAPKPLAALLSDGLHFNAAGNKLMFQKLFRLIMKEWPELQPEAIEFALPVWMNRTAWGAVFERRQED